MPSPDTEEPPPGIPQVFSEYVRLIYDMLHLAFQTDSTRIATFMLNGDGSNRDFAKSASTRAITPSRITATTPRR